MKESTPSKHLWLELKPDYIDANFEQVLSYLESFRGSSDSQDTFYRTTLDLLRQRAKELVSYETTKAIGEGENIDKERDIFNIKLLCLYLLNEPEQSENTFKEAFFTLVFLLARCARNKSPEMLEELVCLDLKILSCESVESTGISWDIFKLFSTDLLSHRILNEHVLVDSPTRFVLFQNHGTLKANLGKVWIAPTNIDTLKIGESNMVQCLSFLHDSMQVLDVRSNKIKQSDYNNLEKIESFTDDYIQRQVSVKPSVKRVFKYSAGDSVDVELIYKGETLRVRTIDPDYETIEGDLVISNGDNVFHYYHMKDFHMYLHIGDQFPVKLQSYSEKGNSKFSINDEFKDYLIDDIYKRDNYYHSVLACLKDIIPNKKGEDKMLWWTELGFPAYTDYQSGLAKGQMAYIELSDTGTDRYRHYVNAYYDSEADEGETFDEEDSKRFSIEDFVYKNSFPLPEDVDDVELEETLPKQLCRLLYYYQKTLRSASDRYRLLSTCRILAKLVGDEDATTYIEFVSDYLENVVAFADDEYSKITELQIPEEIKDDQGSFIRSEIVRILMEYGKEEDSETLDSIINGSANDLLERIAKLVQSANRIKNVVSDNLLVHIKKEIISNLSIDTEDKTDLEESKGVFYGVEDVTKEFKTSFFEAPDNSKHPQNWTIFKEVCAFLNSELGGTIYLGVQDTGYALGLDRDMMNLAKIGNKAYVDNIDGYRRYILDDAKRFFADQSVLMNLTFTPLENDRVLAIKVEPWHNGIVEMDGKAFIRLDCESPVMDSQMKDDIIRRKLLSRKDEAEIIRNLIKAREEKRCVNLLGYSSSSRTETRYSMEPFAFEDDYQTVWCFEPASGRCKTYKVSRIGSVAILNEKWKNESKHHPGKTDIFRMTGDKEIHVEMQLDQFAKLLLCEEFPKAIDYLQPNPDKTSWYLQTSVRALEGVGRFYIGLGKRHITIINSPELEDYIREYVNSIL